MAKSKLLLKRGPIELWQSWHDQDRPWYVVVSPDGIYNFPSCGNPDNDRQAIDRVRDLKERYKVRDNTRE
jgi:hypothetical protein